MEDKKVILEVKDLKNISLLEKASWIKIKICKGC